MLFLYALFLCAIFMFICSFLSSFYALFMLFLCSFYFYALFLFLFALFYALFMRTFYALFLCVLLLCPLYSLFIWALFMFSFYALLLCDLLLCSLYSLLLCALSVFFLCALFMCFFFFALFVFALFMCFFYAFFLFAFFMRSFGLTDRNAIMPLNREFNWRFIFSKRNIQYFMYVRKNSSKTYGRARQEFFQCFWWPATFWCFSTNKQLSILWWYYPERSFERERNNHSAMPI